MKATAEVKPKSLSREKLVVEDLGSELMIYDQARNQAFCLNQNAAFVWQHCDGNTSVSELAAELSRCTGQAVDEQVVEFALHTLSQDGLLVRSTLAPVVPFALTRRQVIQKLGVRAAIALPVVTALMVATPKAHASGKDNGGGKKHKH